MKRFETPSTVNSALTGIGAAALEVIELCDSLDDTPLWVKNTSGHYKWVNRSFLESFGIDCREKVLGLTDYDLCTSEHADQYRVDDERVLAGEKIVARQELIGHLNRSGRWCSTTKIPLHSSEGAIVGIAGIARPIGSKNSITTADPLSRAINLMLDQPGDSHSNEALAKAAGMSQRAFERQFRNRYKCTPQHYKRQLRVRMSCRAVAQTNESFANVAAEFGFADQSHFSREFHRLVGVTPRQYRLGLRTKAVIAENGLLAS